MRDALSLLDQVLAFGGGRALESRGARAARHARPPARARRILDGAGGEGRRGADGAGVRSSTSARRTTTRRSANCRRAIQRMALLQALPDLRGEDEEQDAAARGARRRSSRPRTCSCSTRSRSWRGATSTSRRTRAAVSRWRCCGCWRSGRRRRRARLRPRRRRRRGRPRRLAAPARSRRRAATAGASSGCRRRRAAPQLRRLRRRADDWAAIVAALGLQGPARAARGALRAASGAQATSCRLRLDRGGDAFRRPQLEQKLAQALSQHFGEPVRLEISVADADRIESTPARQQAQAADERLTGGASRRSTAIRPCARCAKSSARRCSRAPSSR